MRTAYLLSYLVSVPTMLRSPPGDNRHLSYQGNGKMSFEKVLLQRTLLSRESVPCVPDVLIYLKCLLADSKYFECIDYNNYRLKPDTQRYVGNTV